MKKIYKNALVLSIAVTLIFGANIILAQTQDNDSIILDNATSTESEEIQSIINEDENITAEDLEIEEPTLLPGNPFYFMKSIGRSIRSTLTFNPVKRAELKLRFANERLIEIKKITESDDNDPKLLEKAFNKYEKELGKIEKLTEKIKEKDEERAEKFIDKFIDNQIKHQRLFGKIEKNVPEEVLEKMRENRQIAIQALSNVPLALIAADRFQEKIEEEMENQDGSDFKNFKNLEILKELEDKVPEKAKDAIRRAQENTLQRLNEKMRNNEEMIEKLPLYIKIKNLDGEIEKHLEIINELEITNELNDQTMSEGMKNALTKAREINIERIENKIERIKTNKETEETTENTDNNKTGVTERIMTFQESSKEQIEKAAAMIEKAKTNFEEAKNNSAVSDRLNSASILIKNAQAHLEKARAAYDKELFGEAFGQANSATSNAVNALRMIAKLEMIQGLETENNDGENEEKTDNDETIKNETNNNTTTDNDGNASTEDENSSATANDISTE